MNYKIFNFVVDVIFITLGFCLILGRYQVVKIFRNAVSIHKIPYNKLQENILLIIIWSVGVMFIFGSIIHITSQM